MDDEEAIETLQALIDWSSSFQLHANLLGREAMEVTHALEHTVKTIETLAKVREHWASVRSARLSDDVSADTNALDELLGAEL